MLLVSSVLLVLLSKTIARSTFDTYTAATSNIGAPTGICNNENGLLSCIPQATVCPGTIPAIVSSCGCTNVQTVINCYSTFCPAQLTEAEVMVLSSYSDVLCHGIGTITLPSGVLSTSGGAAAAPTLPSSTNAETTSSMGKVAGTTSTKGAAATGAGTGTASGGATSSTSKAAGMGGMGNTVPVMGGLLGALVGVVGLFL